MENGELEKKGGRETTEEAAAVTRARDDEA